MSRETTLLVTTVKDEGPNILEWVAHHRLCGFDHIQVYQNDSTDFTVRTLRTLDRLGIIEFHNNKNAKGAHQIQAYRRASWSEAYAKSKWCMVLDGDEFLNVKLGDREVGDLTGACAGADAILVNWKLFGTSGHTEIGDDLITERFTLAEADDRIKESLTAFKPLFRTHAFKRSGIHLPKVPLIDAPRMVNGSGLADGTFERVNWRSKDPAGRSLAQVNHYIVRDLQSFLLKRARGSANAPNRDVGLKYWNAYNRNEEPDLILANRAKALLDEMHRLDALSGGRLMHLRARSLRVWRKRYEDVQDNQDLQALRKAIEGSAVA
ncbi:MAG: glycosyltransferase family 2 protein [Silicimonas sp.]|nr:glycosyltransferase family 2 protein [Silicimonas sp.]